MRPTWPLTSGVVNSGLLAEVEEALLEDAEGLRELGKVGVPGRPECTRADPAFAEHGLEPHRVEHPAVIGLSQCSS